MSNDLEQQVLEQESYLMEQDEELRMIMEMEEKGVKPETIASFLDARRATTAEYTALDYLKEQSKSAFKKAEKPVIFKHSNKNQPFEPLFQLASTAEYHLNGKDRVVRKLSLRDAIRIGSKLPKWLNYIGHQLPDMLIDPLTGRYRVMETLAELMDRMFEYDYELDRPTDFSVSVLEEICHLLNLTREELGVDPVDYLLSCDPEEVIEATMHMIGYNKGFFTKLWNSNGMLKRVTSLISGVITEQIVSVEKKLNLKRAEQKPTKSESEDSSMDTLGGQEIGG